MINLLIFFSINRLVVLSIKCQKIVKNVDQYFPKPKTTSSNVLFHPQHIHNSQTRGCSHHEPSRLFIKNCLNQKSSTAAATQTVPAPFLFRTFTIQYKQCKEPLVKQKGFLCIFLVNNTVKATLHYSLQRTVWYKPQGFCIFANQRLFMF